MDNQQKEELFALIETYFPKGECKERGKALLWNAHVYQLVDMWMKEAYQEGYLAGTMEAL